MRDAGVRFGSLTLVAVVATAFLRPALATEVPDRTRSLSLVYDRELGADNKVRAIASTVLTLRDIGIHVSYAPADVQAAVEASGARLSASPLTDPHLLYDAVHYLIDLVRLPAGTYPLFRNIVVAKDVRVEDGRTGRKRAAAIAYVDSAGALVINHENLNQLESFGNFAHPKVNFAMLLEAALEARLLQMGRPALRELGLDLVVDDNEWARLNGGHDGWSAYNGEDVTFVGLKTAARVTPPGMLYDAIREAKTGVPTTAYAGMPQASPPWWSPRSGPPSDRQNILRCLFSRSPEFFDRLGGRNGVREDLILQEKTRLILYSAFVASGGVLDHAFWIRRHPGNVTVDDLTRDFDTSFRERMNERLQRNPETRGIRVEPLH